MKVWIATSCLLALGITAAKAQDITLPSSALMRTQGQILYRDLNNMVKGEAAFDLQKAKDLLNELTQTASKVPDAFPESSKGKRTTNARYAASPKVWETPQEFRDLAQKLGDASRQAAASVKTLDDLKTLYPQVNGSCNACHERYRDRLQ